MKNIKKIISFYILCAFVFSLVGCSSSVLDMAYQGDMTGIKLAVQKGKDINRADGYGFTALMYAAKYNYYSIAEYLLEHGANVNLQNSDGQTALMIASMSNYIAMAKLLLKYHANLELVDRTGTNATTYAMVNNYLELHKILLSASK